MTSSPHYLQDELYSRVTDDPRLFEFLQSGSLDGIWYWDVQDGDAEWMSPRFWSTLGYDPAARAHSASEWQDLIHPDDLLEARALIGAHLADPEVPYDQVVRYRHRDGSTVWIRCRGIAIRDDDGTPTRMLGAHNDITALMKVQEELRAANESLSRVNRANQLLSSFASVASHDLREPARKVIAFASRLRRSDGERLSDTGLESLERLEVAAKRMSAIVQGLLRLGRVTDTARPSDSCQLDVVVRVALRELEEVVGSRNAVVEVEPLPRTRGDAETWGFLVGNLLSNALKFVPPERSPEVAVRSVVGPDGRQGMAIVDNGVGIPAGSEERVFELFARMHAREAFDGSGIGLALVHRVATLFGAEVEACNNPDGGATFTVWLAP